MKQRFILSSLVYLLFTAGNLFAHNPALNLRDPYFLKPNEVYFAGGMDFIGLRDGFLSLYSMNLTYGINDNVQVKMEIPYLTMVGMDDGGCFGDASASIKLDLVHDDTLSWRVLADFLFRFPTGLIPENGVRTLQGKTVSYYPFSSGSPLLSPGITTCFLLGDWVLNSSFSYLSESAAGENIFYINPAYDRLDFQLGADYAFRFKKDGKSWLFIRPVLNIDYQRNLSVLVSVPDLLAVSIGCNIRLLPDWKLVLGYTFPVYLEKPLFDYHFLLEIGRYF